MEPTPEEPFAVLLLKLALYMQATEQYCDNDNAYYLTGIPSDYTLMFEPAWDNGSRVHTNSWGSNAAGAYTSGSMQADSSARTYQNMTILFSAGNNGCRR